MPFLVWISEIFSDESGKAGGRPLRDKADVRDRALGEEGEPHEGGEVATVVIG